MKIQFSGAGERDPLFSFVVVADTHINESENASSSPFETNRLANARARFVFDQISKLENSPAFVVHLGDIVHPVPGMPGFGDAVGLFREIAAPLSVPLHVIPGNHDVGDKRVSWMPADQVCDEYLKTYREAFGPDYYAFDHGPVRFVMLNSLLLNSGLDDEDRQARWFENELIENVHRRVFVFMHYPPYIYQPTERGNYDNIDEPARSWLIQQLEHPQVEAIFAGHVHNYWYDNLGTAEMYMLPSTAFVRHDFTEFYRVATAIEHGRGDLERFGYFWVDVFETADADTEAAAHVAYSIRTMGEQCKPGESIKTDRQFWLAHPKTSGFDRVGVELRHPWTESVQIASTGGVQEFGRKWARNDYPLLALTEMGVRLCKVPDIDISETESAERMAMLAAVNQRFIVTSLGPPREGLLQQELSALGVVAFEVNATAENFQSQLDRYSAARRSSGLDVYFAKILANDDSRFDGQQFTHFVKSGFTLAELDVHRSMIEAAIDASAIDGITLRHELDDDLVQCAHRLLEFIEQLRCRVLVSIKLAGASVAVERAEDRKVAATVAQAMVLSRLDERISYVFDTFMDVDRGYYPRHAFIDRRFNPRLPARSFAMLNAVLSSCSKFAWQADPGAQFATGMEQVLHFSADDRQFALLTLNSNTDVSAMNEIGSARKVFDLFAEQEFSTREFLESSFDVADTACLLCEY